MLGRFGFFDVLAEGTDGNEALNLIITRKPQVAFLDINMPGISVFQSIPSLNSPPMIIFQTAYSEHAARAFEIDALDYLLKPVRFERLEKTVARIRERLTTSSTAGNEETGERAVPQQIAVTVNGKTRVLPVDGIARISFENGFCTIYTLTEKLMSDKFLNYYEEKLHGARFFRSSRNDLINLNHLSVIHKGLPGEYFIELKNGVQVDLSRRRAQALRLLIDF